MGQNTTVLGIIGVVIIIVVILSPTLIVAGQNFLNDAFEAWQNFWSSLFGGLGGTNNLGIGATVFYKDGTNKTLGDGLIPLTVYFEDKPIDYVQFDLWGKFEYTGEITNLYRDATIEFDFNRDGVPEKYKTEKNTLAESLIPQSGASFRLVYVQITATEIESYASSSGEYTSEIRGRATVDLTFLDGETSTLESDGDAKATFSFTVSVSGATSGLTLNVIPRPWKAPPPKIS